MWQSAEVRHASTRRAALAPASSWSVPSLKQSEQTVTQTSGREGSGCSATNLASSPELQAAHLRAPRAAGALPETVEREGNQSEAEDHIRLQRRGQPESGPPAQPERRLHPPETKIQPACRLFAAETQTQAGNPGPLWVLKLCTSRPTLWYSMESWVSSMIRSTSSIDITCREENSPFSGEQGSSHGAQPNASYLVHLLQTLVSDLQPVDHLLFNLSKLQILDLK